MPERCTKNEEVVSGQSRSSCFRRGWNYYRLTHIIVPLLLGQILAGLLAVTAICSGLLVQIDISLPLTQNWLHYTFLSLFYLSVRLFRYNRCTTHPSPEDVATVNIGKWSSWKRWKVISLYLAAGLFDVHANWAFVAAYNYTSVTSVQLLDCLTIPTTILLSFLFLRNRFLWTHYTAMLICLAGAGGMVVVDFLYPTNSTNSSAGVNETAEVNSVISNVPNIVLGDFLVIAGAVAYGASNVIEQYLVMKFGVVNFLTFIGLTAFVPATIYSLTIERADIINTFSSSHENLAKVVGCFLGYAAAMFFLYSLMPYVLQKTSAVLVNLSLLTADIYALFMGLYLFQNQFHFLYIVCFLVILIGVALFTFREPVISDRHIPWRHLCLRIFHHESAQPCMKTNVSGNSDLMLPENEPETTAYAC